MVKFTRPHEEHRRELLEDLMDLKASSAAKAKEVVPMIKFISDPVKSRDELLADLAEAGIVIGDWMFLASVVDPADFTTHNVVVYTEGDDMFPEDYTEEKATEEFLALMHTVVTIGV